MGDGLEGVGRMTGMGHAIEQAARMLWDCDNDEFTAERRDMVWAEMSGSEPFEEYIDYVCRARALAEAGLLAPAPLREEAIEEAYQRGHEDGYWNGKTTDMSPVQAAKFMAPYRSRCGAWGGCPLPAGHNVGQADIPENHAEGVGRTDQ